MKKIKYSLFINKLPKEMIEHIVKYLKLKDISLLYKTTKKFKYIFSFVKEIDLKLKKNIKFNLDDFTNINEIKLFGMDLDNNHSSTLLKSLKKLTKLSIYLLKFKGYEKFIHKLIINNKSTLKYLKVFISERFGYNVGNKELCVFENSLPYLCQLETLFIDNYWGCFVMKNYNIKNLKNLQVVHLSFVYWDQDLRYLPNTIKELSINGCIIGVNFDYIFDYFKNLKKINLDNYTDMTLFSEKCNKNNIIHIKDVIKFDDL